MRTAFLIPLSFIGTAATAAPTYLACSVTDSSKTFAVEVTADESQQRATVVLPDTGRVVTRKALFAPDRVEILDDESTWVIDRITLDFHRIVVIGDDRSDNPGKCALKAAPA